MSEEDFTEVTRRFERRKNLSTKQEEARVVVLGGNLAGDRFAIEGELLFGRGTEVHVRLDDSLVSRRHARIFQHVNGVHVIEDLQSRNGTQVNGRSIERQLLNYGDRIQIGSSLLLFTHHDPMEDQIENRRRLEAIGRLGTGVAHDFNNLLGAVSASIDFLIDAPTDTAMSDADVRQALKDIRSAASAATEMTNRLLGFARETHGSHAKLDLSELCNSVVEVAERTFHRSIKIDNQIEPSLDVLGDKGQLHQLLMNLFINARDAMPEGGKLSLVARQASQEDLESAPLNPLVEHVLITVTDTGIGMDADTRDRAFDPFFTTKSGEAGAGLGLASVYEVARAHNGHVTVHSQPNRGTKFQVVLPLNGKPTAVSVGPSRRPKAKPTTQLLILLVDDEDVVRRSAGRVVRQSGHRVIFARGGEEALKVYAETKPRPDVVLMDLNMPGMTGDEAFRRLRRLDPQAPVVFVSGYWENDLERDLRSEGALGFVQKPYEAATLRDAIVQAMTAQAS